MLREHPESVLTMSENCSLLFGCRQETGFCLFGFLFLAPSFLFDIIFGAQHVFMSLDEEMNGWQNAAAGLNFSSRVLHVSRSEDTSTILLEEVQAVASNSVFLLVINLLLALYSNQDYVFLILLIFVSMFRFLIGH